MFQGTVPQEERVLLQEVMKAAHKKGEVFIGCSGNFTIDRVMAKMGFRVHSNDVSLYSKLIADILMGTDTEVAVLDPLLEEVFDKWEESRYKKLAEVMFVMRISAFYKRANFYQIEMFNAFIEQAERYYKRTIAKIEKATEGVKIEDFAYEDFLVFLKNKRGKGVGIAFPPTYKGGYEKMFQFVEQVFSYEHAPYEVFDPKSGNVVFKELLERDENIIYTDRNFEELSEYLIGKCNMVREKKAIYTYSSIGKEEHYYIERRKTCKASCLKVIPLDYEFSKESKISVELCGMDDVNYFKMFYMANKVNYTMGGDLALVFKADGKAFGFASFSKQLSDMRQVYMQSDFVVNAKTQRLSKLLIMLVRSREVRKLIAQKLGNYYECVKTTVYTDKPVSQKYRGPFKLVRRDAGKLMYEGEFQEETISQIYSVWLKRYEKLNKEG